MKTHEKTLYLIYDVLDDEPSETTSNRDFAVEASLERKRDVFERRIVSTLLDSGATVVTTITEPFRGGTK